MTRSENTALHSNQNDECGRYEVKTGVVQKTVLTMVLSVHSVVVLLISVVCVFVV